ncbi:MAG: hypothetical protein NUW24_17015 [Anaerolineae bacterium]|jgi:hypothetical protein|nr:hypothetical protein [Anaerolineae bacterium]
MKTKVRDLIAECKAAAERPGAYGFLPDIIGELEDIQSELEKDEPDPNILLVWTRGLGRLVTESYAFSESPLGGKLLDLVTEIVSRYDPRFRQESGKG